MSWASETNIRGPKGDKGDKGDPGPSGTGTGDVIGPAGAVADRIAVYSGTTGKLIKDGGKLISELGSGVASGITVTPAGNISSTNVQAALQELDTEKVAKAGDTMTGNLTVSKSNPSYVLQKTASGQANQIAGYNDVNPRWSITLGDSAAESGSNAGSNFGLYRFTDAGAQIDAPLTIARSSGVIDFKTTPTVSGVPMGVAPATATPIMDGAAAVGVAAKYAREDHVHPSDVNARAVRFDAAQGLTVNQQAQGRANIGSLKKNYILNSAMMVSQEIGAAALTTGGFVVDQFSLSFSNTGAQTAQQVASPTPGGSPNRIRLTATTADASVAAADYCVLIHSIEGFKVADLRAGSAAAKTVMLQFGVKAPAGTYCVEIRNGASNRYYVAEYTIAAGEANTDVVKQITLTLDTTGTWATDNTTGLTIVWTLMAGTNYQAAAGVWTAGNMLGTANQFNFMGTAGNIFELFDVGFYEGSVAPSFMVPDFISELALCKRYYEKTYNLAVAPGTSGAGGSLAKIVPSNTVAANQDYGNVSFTVSKRAAPTVTLYGFSGTSGTVSSQGGGDLAAGSGNAVGIGENGFGGRNGAASVTTSGNVVLFQYVANARLP